MEAIVAVLSKIMPVVGILLAILWLFVPFAIFGLKPRLDELIAQQKLTNKLLAELQPRPVEIEPL